MTTTHNPEAIEPTSTLRDLHRKDLEEDLKKVNPADVARLLEKARSLIEDPAHWIKGKYEDVRYGEKCFCLDGALMMADNGETGEELTDDYWAAYAALRLTIDGGLVTFNDDSATTHADVMRVLDAAIAEVSA